MRRRCKKYRGCTNCRNECCANGVSTPTYGEKISGVVNITVENSCNGEPLVDEAIGVIELVDDLGTVVARMRGSTLDTVDTWSDEIGHMSDYVTPELWVDFDFDYAYFGYNIEHKVQTGDFTIRTYFDNDTCKSTIGEDTECLEPQLRINEFIPDSPVEATVIASTGIAFPVGRTFHRRWKVLIGRDIWAIYESEQPFAVQGIGNGQRLGAPNPAAYYTLDNPTGIYNVNQEMHTTLTLLSPQDCFGILLRDLDGANEQALNFATNGDVQDGFDTYEIKQGSIQPPPTYTNGTYEDAIASSQNTYVYVNFEKAVPVETIEWDWIRTSIQYGYSVRDFRICPCL